MKSLKLKNIFLLVFCFLFLINCKEKKEKKISNKTEIETLLIDANNRNLDKKTRLKNADNLFEVLKNQKNDSLNRYYYFKLIDRYYNLNEEKKFKEISEKVLELSKSTNDLDGVAKSYKNLGDYYYNIFQNDSAYYFFTKSEKTFQKIKSKEYFTDIKLYKANILLFEKDFAGCEIATIDILKKAIKDKDFRLIYDCYTTLGSTLVGLNNQEKAIEYFNKALLITNNLKSDSQYNSLKAQVYLYLGYIYNRDKNYLKAIENFNKGLNLNNSKKIEPYLYANFINNLAYSKFKLGDKSAINQFNEAYRILDSLKNIPGIVSSKINLSEYYLYQKDTLKALTFSNEARKMAHENKIFEDELKTLELLAKIDPKQSLSYNNRFIKLTDSLQNNERATRNKFARIEFETDEILNQKNEIETQKDKISSQRWLILGSSLLILLIGGLLYFSKMQHSKNKVLEFEKEQQKANEAIYQLMLDQQLKIDEGRNVEKKRISQELHDGIMSKLTSIRLNLFALKMKNDDETIKNCLKQIDKIQDVEVEIREISHDLSRDIFITKDSFKIIIEELFENQSKITGWNYQLSIDQNINWEILESNTKMHLYRIFQESLQNIHKYAQAKNITTNINKTENQICIDIIDDGIGFDVSKAKSGIGLENMKSRSGLINATLNISSKKDKGTNTTLIIPI